MTQRKTKEKRRTLPLAMNMPLAVSIVGSTLGHASKMPGRTWGISAKDCNAGSKIALTPGTVCASCYARRGHYTAGSVVRAHERRLAAISDPRWAEAMAYLINTLGVEWFRWFDAGDIQSIEHLDKIFQVCAKTPNTNHWLPTHEVFLVGGFLKSREVPQNLCIRISADYVEDRPYETFGLPTSTVHLHKGEPVPSASQKRSESIECTAYKRENHCGSCRACWEPAVLNVSYPKH